MEIEEKLRSFYVLRTILTHLTGAFLLITGLLTMGLHEVRAQNPENYHKLDTILDTLVAQRIDEYQLPGAVVAVIQNGDVLYNKGFGYAELDEQRPIDPESTRFRLASISKTFTAIAVLQLAEQNKVDLHTDVNTYLPANFKLEDQFRRPVTLFNLLTHTGGFDDRYIGKVSKNPYEADSLGVFLKNMMPERVYPPGLFYSYSNFGVALAGYVVERVSGLTFSKYLEQHILEPLGMENSGMQTDSMMLSHRAVGYHSDHGFLEELPYDYVMDAPAGQIYATSSDMIRFMQALVNGGVNSHGRVLDSATATYMEQTQFTHHPKLHDGVGMTFYIGEENGYKTVSHAGGYMGTMTRMTMIPEKQTGWFIATNKRDGRLIEDLQNVLTDQLLASKNPDGENETDQPSSNFIKVSIDEYTGTYRNTRYPRNTIDKVAVLGGAVGGEMKLTSRGDTLIMPKYGSGTRRLLPVDPVLFKSLDDDYYLAFGRDQDRNIAFAYTSGTSAMEKIPWYYTVSFQLIVVAGGFLLQLLLFIGLMASVIRRRFRDGMTPKAGRSLRISALSTATLLLLHNIGFIIVLLVMLPRHELMSGIPYGLPGTIYLVQLFSYLAIAAAGLWAAYLIVEWFRKTMHWGIRTLYSLALLGTGVYLWALEYWNMIGFRF